MAVVLTLLGIVLGVALPPLKRGYDRVETRAAAEKAVSAFFVARSTAIVRSRPSSVVIDERRKLVAVLAGADTVLAVALGDPHGVTVSATRPSMTYDAAGLGYGGANLSVMLARGAAAETVLVSREGRVKLGARGR